MADTAAVEEVEEDSLAGWAVMQAMVYQSGSGTSGKIKINLKTLCQFYCKDYLLVITRLSSMR